MSKIASSILSFLPYNHQFKKVDVLYHSNFRHPIIILKCKKESYICAMLTSDEQEANFPTQSRFYKDKFISIILIEVFKTSMIEFPFKSVYDNNKHLTEIYKHLLLNIQ